VRSPPHLARPAVHAHAQRGGAGLEVQSWLRGEGALPSFCPPAGASGAYPVTNIRALAAAAARRAWNTTTDHSKWAVGTPPPWRGPADGLLDVDRGRGGPPGPEMSPARHAPGAEGGNRTSGRDGAGGLGLGSGSGLGLADMGEAPGAWYGAACVGDLNRERGQLVRGGSALCFAGHAGVWRALRRLVATVEVCAPGAH